MDRYMKAVLTVIAVALVWLCLKQPMPAAEAKATPAKAAGPARTAPVQEVVRAKRFEVVDGKGRVRIELSMGADGRLPGLRIRDAEDKPRAALGLALDGLSSLILCDKAGKPRAALSVPPDGSPLLVLADEKGKTRAALSLNSEGCSGLSLWGTSGVTLRDAEDKPRVGLPLALDGPLGLLLCDNAGNPRAGLTLDTDGSPALDLRDEKGRQRAALGTTSLEMTHTGATEKRAESSLVLFDRDGKAIWQAPQ